MPGKASLFVLVGTDYCIRFVHLLAACGTTTQTVVEALDAVKDRYWAMDAAVRTMLATSRPCGSVWYASIFSA